MDETGAVFRKSPLRMRMRPQAQGQRHQQLPPGDQHFRGPRDKPPTGMSQPMGIGPAEREPKRRRRNRDRGTGGTTLDFSSSSTDAIGISSARDGRARKRSRTKCHCAVASSQLHTVEQLLEQMSSLRDSDKICPNEMDTVRSSLRNIIDKADIDEVMLSDEDMRRQHLSIITLLKALLTQFPPLFFWSKAGNEAEDNPMQITADNQQFHCWTVSRIIHFLVDPSNLASANLATDFLRTLFELGSFDPVTSRSLMDVLDGLVCFVEDAVKFLEQPNKPAVTIVSQETDLLPQLLFSGRTQNLPSMLYETGPCDEIQIAFLIGALFDIIRSCIRTSSDISLGTRQTVSNVCFKALYLFQNIFRSSAGQPSQVSVMHSQISCFYLLILSKFGTDFDYDYSWIGIIPKVFAWIVEHVELRSSHDNSTDELWDDASSKFLQSALDVLSQSHIDSSILQECSDFISALVKPSSFQKLRGDSLKILLFSLLERMWTLNDGALDNSVTTDLEKLIDYFGKNKDVQNAYFKLMSLTRTLCMHEPLLGDIGVFSNQDTASVDNHLSMKLHLTNVSLSSLLGPSTTSNVVPDLNFASLPIELLTHIINLACKFPERFAKQYMSLLCDDKSFVAPNKTKAVTNDSIPEEELEDLGLSIKKLITSILTLCSSCIIHSGDLHSLSSLVTLLAHSLTHHLLPLGRNFWKVRIGLLVSVLWILQLPFLSQLFAASSEMEPKFTQKAKETIELIELLFNQIAATAELEVEVFKSLSLDNVKMLSRRFSTQSYKCSMRDSAVPANDTKCESDQHVQISCLQAIIALVSSEDCMALLGSLNSALPHHTSTLSFWIVVRCSMPDSCESVRTSSWSGARMLFYKENTRVQKSVEGLDWMIQHLSIDMSDSTNLIEYAIQKVKQMLKVFVKESEDIENAHLCPLTWPVQSGILEAAQAYPMDENFLSGSLHSRDILQFTRFFFGVSNTYSTRMRYWSMEALFYFILIVDSETLLSIVKSMCGDSESNNELASLDVVFQHVIMSLSSSTRMVRLAASQVLVSILWRITSEESQTADLLVQKYLSILLSELNDFLRTIKVDTFAAKETAIGAAGMLLRIKNQTVLCRSVCFLLQFLVDDNQLVQSLAVTEILNLDTIWNVSTPQLLCPIIKQVCVQISDNLQQFIKHRSDPVIRMIFGKSFEQMLNENTKTIVPHLILTEQRDKLTLVAQLLSEDATTLTVNSIGEAIALILLEDNKPISHAFNFLISMITTDGSTVTLRSLFTLGSLRLLIPLCIALGDKKDAQRKRGLSALGLAVENIDFTKVETSDRQISASSAQKIESNYSSVLSFYMLGILSHYNTILISNTETIEEKIRIVSSLGKIVELIGQPVSFVTLQILTTLQTALEIDVLRTAALNSWNLFIRTLLPQDIVPVLSRLVVVVADLHERCTAYQLQLIVGTLEYLLLELGPKLGPDYYELPLLPNVVEFQHINRQIQENRNSHGVLEIICLLLPGVMNENSAVVKQSLHEMIKVLQENCEFLNEHVLEESINSCIPLLIKHLLETCSRFNGSSLDIQLLCAKCLGVLGAVDPGRLEFTRDEERLLVLDNNSSPEDSLSFVCVLIEKQLVPAFRSAPSTKVQDKIALTLQELLKTFGFDSKLISGHLSIGNKDPRKSILQKWQAFPKSVQEVIQPFLESKYGIQEANTGQSKLSSPLYPKRANYKEWIQMWALDLINRLPESIPKKVFALCGRLIKGADANISIVLFILPHIILNVLLAGSEDDQQDLLVEVTTVLTDSSLSDIGAREKREFACQTIFILVDHLTKYMRHRRLSLAKRQVKKSVKVDDSHNVTVIRACKIVEHFLAQIPQDIMAQASYRCKAYERAVMHFEQHMRHQGAIAPGWWSSTIQSDNDAESYKLPSSQNLYSHLQQIYSNIDDPDGMSGIAAMFRNPTIEQQILEHESSGNWSAMQTCFEILLKNDPTNLKHHIGLIRCLKNLGHFETMINHVNGAIVTHPDWKKYLAGYAIEASWRLAHWDDIEHFLQISHEENFEVSLGQLLLAGQKLDVLSFNNTLRKVRASLMAPLAAASMESYQRCYDHIRKLHMLSEIESVFEVQQDPKDVEENAKRLFATWELRLKSTVASFRVREPILNLRRVLLAQMMSHEDSKGKRRVIDECGKNWLQAAKVARKAGYIQTAFSAIMHAEEMHSGQAHIERAKWHWTNREFRKGISELQSALETSFAVTADDGNPSAANGSMSTLHIRAKTNLLLARWMDEKCMGNPSALQQKYKSVIEDQAEWEKGHYYLGRFYNKLYETEKKNTTSQRALGPSYALFVCKSYAQSLTYGTRFIYNTLPRLLTIWMDLGTTVTNKDIENNATIKDEKVKRFMEMNKTVKRLITKLPTYYFLTTFPQIVSRICHPNDSLYTSLERIMIQVMTVYPQHALWHLISVYRSTYKFRSARCSAVFSKVKAQPSSGHVNTVSLDKLIAEAMKLTEQLLILCNHQISSRDPSLSMSATFKVLSKMQKLSMIIPLQSNMTVTLPLSSLSHSFESHNPFPNNMPRIEGFRDEIEVMQSLQKPRKITVIGSDGNDYIFLCKPKDDLRKDTRLMEFNSLINKLLKKSAESRKRSLHIRTYAVIPLNEECGLIEWVNNTVGFRNVLVKSYKSKGIYMLPQEAKQVSDRKDLPPAEIFVKHLLPRHPPVFHEWFVETFPEPTRWFASRRAYSTTTAVISMVGHILGLGDRHGENILFDELTGETVHVDFNCLFEKGLTFEKPEKVPFRLTHNMVNAFGVTGVEGVFRNACEATMRVLHLNQELLMTVLETFIYDPLCEWSKRKGGTVSEDRGEVQNEQALRSLNTIKRKLEGWVGQVPYSVEGQVHELINQAMEVQNLSVMYIGWAAFM